MSLIQELPIPTDGPWALSVEPALGIVGSAGVASRLGRHLRVRAIGPRDDVEDIVADIDAIVIELSAFEDPSGAWAYALRPGAFDRGESLTTLLRMARSREVPVLALDDLGATPSGAWQRILASALDDVAQLGPISDVGMDWNPGAHWAADALAVEGGSGAGAPARIHPYFHWTDAQTASVVQGSLIIDRADPWAQHLAAEVSLLGVTVCDANTGELVDPDNAALPSDSISVLCNRLDLRRPSRVAPIVVVDEEPSEFECVELRACIGEEALVVRYDQLAAGTSALMGDARMLLVAPNVPLRASGLRACLDALDRVPDAKAVIAEGGTVVGTYGANARLSGPTGSELYDLVRHFALPRAVPT